MAIAAELQRRLLECVRAYQMEQGEKLLPGVRFEQLEDHACEISDALAKTLIEQVLVEQARDASAEACCPRCQRAASRGEEPEPRLLTTRRGEVGWNEATYYCRYCRQSFFPSLPIAGH
jgi:hypothetical protein